MNIILKDEMKAFFKGFASAFDISGQTLLSLADFNKGFQRDAQALSDDWYRIGNDMRKVMNVIAYEN